MVTESTPWGVMIRVRSGCNMQEEPGGARRSQEEPGGARRSQEEPHPAPRS